VLTLDKPSQLFTIFAGNARSLNQREVTEWFSIWVGSGIIGWNGMPWKTKKKFYALTSCVNVIKLFFGVN
jgi:hypothetical protein